MHIAPDPGIDPLLNLVLTRLADVSLHMDDVSLNLETVHSLRWSFERLIRNRSNFFIMEQQSLAFTEDRTSSNALCVAPHQLSASETAMAPIQRPSLKRKRIESCLSSNRGYDGDIEDGLIECTERHRRQRRIKHHRQQRLDTNDISLPIT